MEAKIVMPSKKDIMNVLKMHYTMRVNATKKNIEHAEITDIDVDGDSDGGEGQPKRVQMDKASECRTSTSGEGMQMTEGAQTGSSEVGSMLVDTSYSQNNKIKQD